MEKIVYCRACSLRFTAECPCYIIVKLNPEGRQIEIDRTEYDGFCWKGVSK